MLTKKEARQKIFDERKNHTSGEILTLSNQVRSRLLTLKEYRKTERVFMYISYNKEPDTIEIIKALFADGKKVAVPGTTFPGAGEREMKFFMIENLNLLAMTERGILEPDFKSGEVFKEAVPRDGDLIIMPGVAFDTELNRAGYGGGYYDTWLREVLDYENDFSVAKTECGEICCIALAFEFQIFEKIESEAHDIKPDMIVTEKRIIKRK